MSGAIDRIHGPHDGIVELMIVVQQDWDSDPFLVMNLRNKVASYQEYLMSEQFRASFAGCRGVIVLETRFFPPEEVQRILAKEGVEIRISSDLPESPAAAQVAAAEGVVQQTPATPPQPIPPSRPSPQTALYGELSPQAAPAPAPSTAPIPAPVAPAAPVQRDPWEVEEDEAFVSGSGGGGSSVSSFVALGFLLLSLGVMIYALIGLMSPAPESSPRAVIPSAISAKTLPKESHATIAVRPDPATFVVVPIQDRAGKEQAKYHILFGVKETPRMLVFASFAQSQIPVRVGYKTDPNDPENKEPKVVFGTMENLQAQTYTGRLERLQRYEHGPLELVLPGGNRDVNKLYKRLNKQFPMDSMILVVGAKPRGPDQPYGVLFLVSLVCAVLSGSAFFALRNRAQRAF